jgi:hypothetical protein
MIKDVLETIKNQLDNYLKAVLTPHTPYVVLGNLVNESTGTMIALDEKIYITVFAIDEEKMMKSQTFTKQVNGVTTIVNPELKLNLNILVSAMFSNYDDGLKALSQTITFFQGKNVFNHQNTPELPEGVDAVYLDFVNQSESEQYDVWTKIGAKYQPSVIYRLRMLTIQANFAQENRVDIETINLNVHQN